MRVVIFGATGFLGKGVLREALIDPRIESVVSVVRRPTGGGDAPSPKLREVLLKGGDFTDLAPIKDHLSNVDVCFWCLGTASMGVSEADYTRITLHYPLAAAEALKAQNGPDKVTYLYLSGEGADTAEKSRIMWARVKGQAENRLLAFPGLKKVYCFRPGAIQPMHDSKPADSHKLMYAIMKPVFPLLHAVAPNYVTTTERVGRAMVQAAATGAAKAVLTSGDINALARAWEAAQPKAKPEL